MTINEPTALSRSVHHLLHRAGQAADELFGGEMKGSDMTPRQLAVLAMLAEHETASQSDLVAATGVDRSTLGDIVKRLLARGLISRRRSRADARAYVVRLTPAGEAALKVALPAAERVGERLLSLIAPARRSEFLQILQEVVRQSETLSRGGPPAER